MRMRKQQFDLERRSVSNGPLVVLGEYKNRDGPLIYHLRDGPIFVTGPPGGTDPPAGTGPPYEARPPGRTGPRHETGPPNGHGPPLKKKQAGVEFESTKVKEKQNINLKREETKMKNFKLKRLLSLAGVGLLAALHMPSVFAAAGTQIGNRATLQFDVGGTLTVLESSLAGNTITGANNGSDTVFTEDRVINFLVATLDGATIPVAPSATLRVQSFAVTNNGNGTQDFLLAALNSTGGTDPFSVTLDSFDPTLTQVFVENGTTVGYQGSGADQDTGVFVDELIVGNSAVVYIVSTIPSAALPLVNGQVSVLTLVAQVAVGGAATTEGAAIMRDDNGNVSPVGTYSNGSTGPTTALAANDVADIITAAGSEQIVFNDPAGATAVDVDSTNAAQDVVQNGQNADASSYTVGAAILTVTKTSAVLWDPVNGNSNPKAIPGAYVQYTVTVANAAGAGASGDLTTLNDVLVLTALDPDLIDGAAVPPAAAGAPENAAGDGIRIDTSGTGRNAALNVSASAVNYCTGAVDPDACSYSGGVGGTLTVALAFLESMDPEAGYTQGELKAGESVVIVFNAIVQ